MRTGLSTGRGQAGSSAAGARPKEVPPSISVPPIEKSPVSAAPGDTEVSVFNDLGPGRIRPSLSAVRGALRRSRFVMEKSICGCYNSSIQSVKSGIAVLPKQEAGRG